MKTRTKGFIVSFILVFAMLIGVFTMMPMTASAASQTVTWNNQSFTKVQEMGYETEIWLSGENSIVVPDCAEGALKFAGDGTIGGSGKLTITINPTEKASGLVGISANGPLTIKDSAQVVIRIDNTNSKSLIRGIECGTLNVIDNASLTIEIIDKHDTEAVGIKAGVNINIATTGNVKVDVNSTKKQYSLLARAIGIVAEKDISIKNATVDVSVQTTKNMGGTGAGIRAKEGNISIEDATVNVKVPSISEQAKRSEMYMFDNYFHTIYAIDAGGTYTSKDDYTITVKNSTIDCDAERGMGCSGTLEIVNSNFEALSTRWDQDEKIDLMLSGGELYIRGSSKVHINTSTSGMAFNGRVRSSKNVIHVDLTEGGEFKIENTSPNLLDGDLYYYVLGETTRLEAGALNYMSTSGRDDWATTVDGKFILRYNADGNAKSPSQINISANNYEIGSYLGNLGLNVVSDGASLKTDSIVFSDSRTELIKSQKSYTFTFELLANKAAGYSLKKVTKNDVKLSGGIVNSVSYNETTGVLTVNATLNAIPSSVGAIELTYEGYLGGKSANDFVINYNGALTGIEAADGSDKIYFVDGNYNKISVNTFAAGTAYNVAFKFKAKSGYQLPDNPSVTLAGATFKKVEKNGDVYTAYFALTECPDEITLNGFEVDIKGVEYGKTPTPVIDVKTQGITISDIKIKTMDGNVYTGALQVGTNYYVSFIVGTESGYKLELSLANNEQYKNILANYNGTTMINSYYSTASGQREVRFEIGSNSIGGTLESYGDNEIIKIELYKKGNSAYPVRVIELVGNNVEYSFSNLPSAEYRIRVAKDGHTPFYSGDNPTIVASGAVDYDIKLTHLCSATTVSENKAGCSTAADSIYYACVCGTCYSDANATNKIDDIAAFIASKGGHDYSEKLIDAEHLKNAATKCTEHSAYWFDCSRCEANAKYDPSATDKYYEVTTETGDHSFTEKIADNTHLVVDTGVHCQSAKMYYYDCEYCNEIGTETWASDVYGDHIMNETYTQKDDKHFKACSVLGCDHTDTPVSCSGGTATCQAKAVCDTCKNAYGDFVAHSYTTVNGYKESDGHANTCSCGAHDTVVPHTPNIENATEDEDKKCTECGYIIQNKLSHTHVLKPVAEVGATCTTDGVKAYYACDCGSHYAEDAEGTKVIENLSEWKLGAGKIAAGHTPNADDGDCTTAITCSVCGAETTAASTHVDADTNGKCDTCSKDMPTTPGGDEPGTDVPGTDEPGTDDPNAGNTEDPTDDNDGLPTGAIIAIVAGSVLVVGIGGFALVWFVIKKKTWAEFLAIFKKG